MNLQKMPESLVTSRSRLATLDAFGILDTPPDPAFDSIVRLATRLCRTPVGLVSFVDADRQWFKARNNFPDCETDLDRSVCKFVLAEPDLLVIPDLAIDPRTASNPLVTGAPFIRFYAGAPLRLPNGQTLGSLCVIDTKPRPAGLTAEQADGLRALAEQVVDRLQLRRAVAERERLIAQQSVELRRASRLDVLARVTTALLLADDPAAALQPILAKAGTVLGFDQVYFYNIALDGQHLQLTHAVNLTPEMRTLFARIPFGTYPCGVVAATLQPLVLADVQSDDDPNYADPRSLGLNAYAGFPLISRGVLSGVLGFSSSESLPFDEEALDFFATLARLMSATYDRLDGEAELAEIGAYWRSLFERLSEGFVVGEVIRDTAGAITNWRYIEVNRAWGELSGVDPRSVIGRSAREVFPGLSEAWITEPARVVDTREPATFLRQLISDGRWFEGPIFALGAERFAMLQLDATERLQADERRAAQLALGDQLGELTTVPEMTRAVSAIVGKVLGATRAGFGRVDADIMFVDIEPDWTAPGIASIAGRHRFADFGNIRDDLRRGELLVIHDVRTDPRTAQDPGPMLELGIGALVNVPVRDRGRTVAVFIVQDDKPHHWTPQTLAFLRNVADRLEAGVARVRAEEDQRLLNEEIAHRLKNTLAMVMSIATQTLRQVPDRAPVQAFEQRLHALSAAHEVLLRRTWTAARLGSVVAAVVSAAGHADRITIEGPELDLGPRATLSASLLVHELATNAAKYGGLSNPAGGVNVTWRLEGEGERSAVIFDWTEWGGPPPVAPAQSKRKGFGSRLIQLGLVGAGDVDLRYPVSGFEATMRAPLTELQSA